MYMRQWREEHREDINARRRAAYLARDAEKTRARVREFRKANPDATASYRAASRDVLRDRSAAWRIANPEKRRAQQHRRRARQVNAAGADYTTDVHIAARWAMYGGRCRYCGDAATSMDHRIPLARGGSHFPANLIPACGSCNSRKNTLTEPEFLARRAA